MEAFMNHEIMTIEEVATYLRVSERTVYDWAQKGPERGPNTYPLAPFGPKWAQLGP